MADWYPVSGRLAGETKTLTKLVVDFWFNLLDAGSIPAISTNLHAFRECSSLVSSGGLTEIRNMAERIYTIGDEGGLEPLEEAPFSTEDELQALIAGHPELLDGEQIRPGDPRRWILITREKGISEHPDAGARWSIDHLIVDQDAVPTLAEVKRGSNPEIRRTVVGQMLEYAAHASQTWTADELRRAFEERADARGLDPMDELRRLLQSDGDPDADAFWQSVETNLSARRLRLLFIADDIPDPLERVVEFLNAQMPNIEVLAVEIKRFQGRSSQTLVPRIIGRIAGSASHGTSGSRRKLTRESFLKEFNSVEARAGVTRLMDVALESGAKLGWGSSSVTVRINCSAWRPPVTVAWLNLPSISSGWMGFRDVGFGAAIFSNEPPPGQELEEILRRWIDQFRADDFAQHHSGVGTEAWVVTYEDAARNIDVLASRLAGVLSELNSL